MIKPFEPPSKFDRFVSRTILNHGFSNADYRVREEGEKSLVDVVLLEKGFVAIVRGCPKADLPIALSEITGSADNEKFAVNF
jgi:hypothetical protein